jgi:hypothetical protein
VAVEAPRGEKYDVGDDAEVRITVTNAAGDQDRLVEVTSPDAEEVVAVDEDGEETELEVPRWARRRAWSSSSCGG